MFPIRDTIRSRSFPIVTVLIIAVNVFIFFFELTLSPAALDRFFFTFGLVPANLNLSNPFTWYPFLTHMFLHGGWLHIISNMWMLLIFGDNVEDRLGSVRYAIFYILGGIAAGALQVFFSKGSSVPSLGASGAIAAVLGAYFLFFPRSRVITFFIVFIFPWFVEIPAFIYLGFWFISQFFSGVLSIGSIQSGGVAWWAHVGGFLFGLIVSLPALSRHRNFKTYPDEYYPW